MAPLVDAVLLDLGNVLAFHDNERLFAGLGEAFGVEPDRLRHGFDGLWERANRGLLPGDQLRQALARGLGREISADTWVERFSCHFTIHEAMVQLVERLVGQVRLVLVSNTHDLHVANLWPRLPVLQRFDGWVLSCNEGLIKPEAEIFRRALAVAGVPGNRAVFFDDVPLFVDAATKEGLRAYVFTTAATARAQLTELGLDV